MTEESLFTAVLEKSSEAERQAFLQEVCGPDHNLRQRLQQLLAAHVQGSGILDQGRDLDRTWTGTITPVLTQGSLVADRYRVLECIGEGGMGAVWAAEQLTPVRRKVALKLLKPGMDSDHILARFEAERQALALMDHAHIAKVLDAGTVEKGQWFVESKDTRTSTDRTSIHAPFSPVGRPFFAMEFVQGLPLTEFCDEARLTVRERLQLFLAICQAVQHAHQKGIVHRDLKPSNILVGWVDGKPVPKVIDFGLAKALHTPLSEHSLHTAAGMMLGTPLYMSPEQAQIHNVDIDTRTDIYSLGVILYELLTGSTPLEKQRLRVADWPELLLAIKEEEPPTPSTRLRASDTLSNIAAQRRVEPQKLWRLVRGELDWIVMKCLEKNRAQRYETASSLARDIERYLHDEPVEAGPPSKAYRLRKFLRRHRGAVAAAVAMFVLLLGGIVATTWQAHLTEQARQEEAKRADGEARARQQAEEEKNIAQALRNFLAYDLLQQADPWTQAKARGQAPSSFETQENPTVRDLLDRAAAAVTPDRLEAKFPGQPLVQAEVLHVIGFTYRRIGESQKALAHLERCRDLYQSARGPDHADTLSALGTLGLAYSDVGRWRDALHVQQQAWEGTTKAFGAEHAATLHAMNNLALTHLEMGNVLEAVRLHERLRQLRTQLHGAEHPDTLTTLNNLASAYQEQGKLRDAIRLYEQVRDVRLKNPGLSHPDTQVTLNNLGEAYVAIRRLPEAIRILEQVRDAQAKIHRPDHPRVLATLNNLASAYRLDGKLTEAIRIFEQVLQRRREKLGPDHPDTLNSLNNLALAYKDAGRLTEALSIWADLVPTARRQLGMGHPNTPQMTHNWILGLQESRQFALAAQVAQEWLALERQRQPTTSPPLEWPLEVAGRSLLRAGRAAEAESLLRELLARSRAKQSEGWTNYYVMSLVGGSLLGQQKYADAEPLLREGYQGMKQGATQVPRRMAIACLVESLERLIQLYTATNRKTEADHWQQELTTLQRKAPAP